MSEQKGLDVRSASKKFLKLPSATISDEPVKLEGGPSRPAPDEGYNFSQVYIDPESVKTQKDAALAMIQAQANLARDRCTAELESHKSSILMKAQHDMAIAEASIEQSRNQALFALDQQHQQRRLEIEQKSQEQKMQIEATSSQLILQAQQQRLQREMTERMVRLQTQQPPTNGASWNLFQTHGNLNSSDHTSLQQQFFSYSPLFSHSPYGNKVDASTSSNMTS